MVVVRTGADAGFWEVLQAWWLQASQVRVGRDVADTISTGTLDRPWCKTATFGRLSSFRQGAPRSRVSFCCWLVRLRSVFVSL